MNFYNEIDSYCCDWLENLIREKLIPDGIVDRRSIVDILPAELNGFTQCHFFAGLGGWPLALRRAAYPDTREVWTGSAPCQPFSTAGKRLGFADDRHLWPYWRYLIAVRRPPTILGEQVASAADWIRLVRGDLEALDYPVGIMPVEAASAGADHLRDRFWFVAHDEHAREGRRRLLGPGESAPATSERTSGQPAGSSHNGVAQGDAHEPGLQGWSVHAERSGERAVGEAGVEYAKSFGWSQGRAEPGLRSGRDAAAESGFPLDMGNSVGAGAGRDGGSGVGAQAPFGSQRQFNGHFCNTFESSGSGDLANGNGERLAQRPQQHERPERSEQQAPFGHDPLRSGFRATFDLGNSDVARAHADSKEGSPRGTISEPGARGYEWVLGADGKARRVESGICLLTDSFSGRVAVRRTVRRADAEVEEEHWYSRVRALKALGNAIDPRPAAAFIRAALNY